MPECIECHEKEARYWDNNYCEECFTDLLNALELEKKDIIEKKELVANG